MTTARERALERVVAFSPRMGSAGELVEELLTAYVVVETARDIITEYRLGAGVSWEKLQAAITALDERRS